jgi:hypothetical protein
LWEKSSHQTPTDPGRADLRNQWADFGIGSRNARNGGDANDLAGFGRMGEDILGFVIL